MAIDRAADMPKVLIVGTVPYNRQSTSRAFDSYFHYWPKDRLAQIFSNPQTPCKGHCSTLFQITDHDILKRWFHHREKTGRVYYDPDLPDTWNLSNKSKSGGLISKLYQIGSHKSSIIYLIRRLLWRKKYWCTPELNEWLDNFRPDCVFLAFSDDFFIPQIALYVAERYGIPIVSCIGDDYYFNYKKTLSPLYHVYKLRYRNLIRRVFAHDGSAIYISNKIRDLYNREFGLEGETVYLTSEVERRPFRYIPEDDPVICYFGNIRLGRNDSLNEIGYALGKIAPGYRLKVYSNELEERQYRKLMDNPNVEYCGQIPYSQVMEHMRDCDIQIIVEGFQKKDVDITRYSLSTKVADSLASGSAIFAYGSIECGAIEYAKSTKCIVTCTSKEALTESLLVMLKDRNQQRINYDTAIEVYNENHTLDSSTSVFTEVVQRVLAKES